MTDNNTISARFQWTFDEFKASQSALPFQINRAMVITGVLIIVLLIPIFPDMVIAIKDGISIPFPLTFTNISVLIGSFIALYLIFKNEKDKGLKNAFSQHPTYNKYIEFYFSPNEIITKIEDGVETKRSWKTLLKVGHTKTGFLFYETTLVYFWVPEHAFSSKEDANKLAELARKNAQNFFET